MSYRHALSALLPLMIVATGCDPTGGDPDLGMSFTHVSHHENFIYASGGFNQAINGNPDIAGAGGVLAVFDGSDPTHPVLLNTLEVGESGWFQKVGNKLVAFRSGNNVRVEVYGLTDPTQPELEKTIVVPGTADGIVGGFLAIDSQTVLFSLGDGVERIDGSPGTFVVRLNNPSGSEVVSSTSLGCARAVMLGVRVHCFSALGGGSGKATTFEISAAGVLTPIQTTSQAELGMPLDAVLTDAGTVVVTDIAGTFTYDLASGFPVLIGTADLRYFASLLNGPAESLVLASAGQIIQVDRGTGATQSTLAYTGGVELSPFNDLYVAALGNNGIVIFSATPSGLTKLGGFYRTWYKDRFNRLKFMEGTY